MQHNKAIEDAIRWHYFDLRRGCDSADPSMSGIDSDVLAGLESCVPESVERLKAEGEQWADLCLNLIFLESEPETWEAASERLKRPLPERPPVVPRERSAGVEVSLTMDSVLFDGTESLLAVARILERS